MSNPSGAKPPPVNADVEVRDVNDDRLNRLPFCRRVVERIDAAGSGPSVVFGLAGPWGSGKTSALNFIEYLLTEERGQEWAVVRFMAWSAGDVGALTDEFYRAIAAAMPATEAGRRAAGRILSMAPVFAAAGKAVVTSAIESKIGKGALRNTSEAIAGALADRAGKFTLEPDPFFKRFEKLSEAINDAGQNVLVVVDDIDRLHTDELLGVLKAVRLLGRFSRVHYLLSYDEQTVLDVLMASDIAKGEEERARQYLEKIIQYPFVLPPLEVSQLEGELRAELLQVAAAHGISPDSSGRRGWDDVDRIIHALPDDDIACMTLRRIKRLASQVEVLCALVGASDLNFIDAILVTYIRLWYPALYEHLPGWRSDLVKDIHVQSFSANEDKNWPNLIVEALGIKVGTSRGDAELEGLLRLMSTLFPGALQKGGMRQDDEQCRIDSRDYFGRYVAQGIPAGDVSDETVREELAALCTNGELSHDSTIIEMLAEPQASALVLRKLRRAIEVIAESPSQNTGRAAVFLNQRLHEGGRVFGRWATVLNALLGHAAAGAPTPEDAQRSLDDFCASAGLLATAEVLYESVAVPGIDPAPMVAASQGVRSRIVDVCRLDLSTDVADIDALRCIDFMRLWPKLPADIIEQLRQEADTLISSGSAKAHELGARFVIVPPARSNTPIAIDRPLLCCEEFEMVVPQAKWSLNELPTEDETTVVVGDGSLRNRVNVAGLAMRRLLSAETGE